MNRPTRLLYRTAFLCLSGLLLLLLPAPALTQEAGEPAESEVGGESDLVEVFNCQFDESVDVNYDSWPDRWTRLRDKEHPQFVRMTIADHRPEDADMPGRRMVIEPDGASAELSSPPILVMPKFSYVLSLKVRVDRAEHGRAVVRIVFADSQGNPKQIEETPPITKRGEWVDLTIGAVRAVDPTVDRCFVQVDFDRGDRGDLDAVVSVADVHIDRQPSIEIHTASPYNVYTDPSDVVVTCSVSGILDKNPEIHFQLLDATNKAIGDEGELEIHGTLISATATRAHDIVDGVGNAREGYQGAIDWRPPIEDYGFYRVRVRMIGSQSRRVIKELSTTVAVVREDLETTDRSEFGWSLPEGDRPLSFAMLQKLLPRVGIQYVKVPVWFHYDDEARGDAIIHFAEKLAAWGIDTVGVLEDPTELLENPLAEGPPPAIQGLLTEDSSRWRKKIDHVITKLSLRIRWWQLGRDRDTSFVGFPNLLETVEDIIHQMFRFGQDVRVGIGYRWDHTREWPYRPLWEFEQMDAKEPLDAVGLNRAFEEASPRQSERWVLVEPPQTGAGISEDHDEEVRRHEFRVRDFVEQIIVAKVHNADAIFVADPFAGAADATLGRTGVMNEDGTPGELLLPWRTCARLLGGATHIGSLRLPGGSRNWLFKRPDGQVVMVVWSEETNVETLYLGREIRVIDIWGKEQEPERDEHRHVVQVDRMPRFVMGLSEALARWRMSTRLVEERVSSIFGVAHKNGLGFDNTYGVGVGGSVSIRPIGANGANASTAVRFAVPDPRFSLAPNASRNMRFDAQLVDAEYGKQPLRIDFDLLDGEERERFSVWRDLTVGLGDLELNIELDYSEDGRLIVKQLMRSHSGPRADFKCLLYAPPLRRKRTQVFQLGPQLDTKQYTFYQGESLAGSEMKLRVEEIAGQRELVKRFIVPTPEAIQKKKKKEEIAEVKTEQDRPVGFSRPVAPLESAGG